MDPWDLTFHHLGLAVKKPDRALRFLESLGYTCGLPAVRDDLQNVNLIMCTHPRMPAVEIVFPTETPGPLERILAAKPEMVYHLCYQTPSIEQAVRRIEESANRVICVSGATPAILFDNHLVAFYHVAGFGLIELLQM
jgi:hypothetical protein